MKKRLSLLLALTVNVTVLAALNEKATAAPLNVTVLPVNVNVAQFNSTVAQLNSTVAQLNLSVAQFNATLAPVIRCQPQWQIAQIDSNATFTVWAENPLPTDPPLQFTYQWQRQGPGGTNFDSFENIVDATNMSYTLYGATTNGLTGPAYFRASVSSTNGATTMSLPAGLLVGNANGTNGLPIYGTPVFVNPPGNRPPCPGAYNGYVSYVFQPDDTCLVGGVPFHTAKDLIHTDTSLEAWDYTGFYFCGGPTSCPNTHHAGEGTYINFTIYFPHKVPTGSYPIYPTGYK